MSIRRKRWFIIVLFAAIVTWAWNRVNISFFEPLSSPEKNFEELWLTFNNRYAFFEAKGVDWHKSYEVYRPQVSKHTTDDKLFSIMCAMLKPLKDGHITLQREDGMEYNPGPESRFFLEFGDQVEELFHVTTKTLKAHKFDELKKPVEILSYSISNDFGYLRILGFEWVKAKHLSSALDEVMGAFEGLKGVIIDIRDNPGGEDKIAYTIANRFVDEKKIGHYKKTKEGPNEADFGSLETWILEPHGQKPFTKPLVLLTHDSSFSAADVFALAMKQLDHVTIIGEPTYGIFSDELFGELPNGWEYSLSHQQYFSPDMICYEGKGVPVDVKVTNTKEDIVRGEDSVIATALNHLKLQITKKIPSPPPFFKGRVDPELQ